MELLKTLKWAEQSIELLNYFKNNISSNTILLFLRHSERFNPEDFDEIQKALLTNTGKKAAYEFGEYLPEEYEYFMFHSPLTRCKQTLIQIEKALKLRNINAQIIGEIIELYKPKLDCIRIKEVIMKDRHNFIYNWLDNKYKEDIIENSQIYSKNAFETIRNTISEYLDKNKKQIFIFLGHDMNLISFRYNWFNLNLQNDWIDPLGGFIIEFLEKENRVYDPILKKTLKMVN